MHETGWKDTGHKILCMPEFHSEGVERTQIPIANQEIIFPLSEIGKAMTTRLTLFLFFLSTRLMTALLKLLARSVLPSTRSDFR